MITLSETGTLQAYIDDTPTTPPVFYADWIDQATNTPGQSYGGFSSSTTVDLVAPAASGVRMVRQLHLTNKDITTREFTVQVSDGMGTYAPYRLVRVSVPTGQTLVYNSSYGWFVQTINYNGTYQPLAAVLTDITDSGAVDFGGFTSFEVPNGAGGKTVNAAGELCVDTTSKTVNFYDGAAEAVLNPTLSKAITVKNPTNAEDISMFFTDPAITITKMVAVLVGSSTPSVTWTVRHSTDRNATGNEVVTGGTTTTSTTTGSVVTSFNDATIPATSFVWLETTAKSGTVTELHLTIFYRQDA